MAGKIAQSFAAHECLEDRAKCALTFSISRGESFIDLQTRIANSLENMIRKHNKPKHIIAVVFHSDPIKLAVSHFLGLPLDHFQRLSCDTGSVTVLYVSETGANLLKLNQRPPFEFLSKEKKK